MRTLALYLPQYHTIPENDEWWGEGFTEWTNVKKAVPLFAGHYQPRIPLDDNYYDLSNRSELISQMSLAKEYGIDGFIFYHYWFKGKKLLEKPIEVLWEYDEVPLDYCLCWANEPWARTWDGQNKNILMPQEYGGAADWEEHYRYFSEFFKKKNYIKIDGKPVLFIYKPSEIIQRKEMFSMWNNLAIEDGFKGLHIVTVCRNGAKNTFPNYGNATFDFEPFSTNIIHTQYKDDICKEEHASVFDKDKKYYTIDYQKFCESMIKRVYFSHNKHYYGIFTGWDNTARRGKDVSIIFDNNAPDVFEWAYERQFQKSLDLYNEFLIINAWNEWSEGTYLQPDTKYKYGYLEAISRVKVKYHGL